MDVFVADDAEQAAVMAASLLAERLRSAVAHKGRATIALSGGSTPVPALRRLGRERLPWGAVHVFQVDERVASDGDPERNLTVIADALPDATIHPMPVDTRDRQGYLEDLRAVAGQPPVLDVVQLGLGDDGHTASWPPGETVPDDGVTMVAGYRGFDRMTLTASVVNGATHIVWLVTGAAKQPVLRHLLDGSAAIPAAAVRRDPNVVVVADRAAVTLP